MNDINLKYQDDEFIWYLGDEQCFIFDNHDKALEHVKEWLKEEHKHYLDIDSAVSTCIRLNLEEPEWLKKHIAKSKKEKKEFLLRNMESLKQELSALEEGEN